MRFRDAKKLHNGDEVFYQNDPAKVLTAKVVPRPGMSPVVRLELLVFGRVYCEVDHPDVRDAPRLRNR